MAACYAHLTAVDMMAYAIDTQAPATIILISGDRDFVYAVSVLCLRQYRLVVLAPHAAHASLKAQASVVYHWPADVLPDEPSPDVAKPRSTTIPDYFRTRSDPLSSTAARLAHPVPASPPMSPAAPRRPIPTSAPSDSALLRPPEPSWMTSDGSPPLVSNLGLPISSGTVCRFSRILFPGIGAKGLLSVCQPASDTTAVDPAAEGRTFLTPSNGQSDYFNDPYQQPSPSPSPKRSSWASIAKLDSTQLSADAPTFTSQLQDNPFNPFAFPSTSTSTSTPAPAPAPIPGKRAVAAHFRPLVKVLRQRLREGVQQVPYSELGTLLRQECASVYEQAGVTKLKEYANLAEEAQVALLTENVYGPGGVDGQRWVSLHPRLVKGAGQKAALKALDEW